MKIPLCKSYLLSQFRRVFRQLPEPWRVSKDWEMAPSWWSAAKGPRPETYSKQTDLLTDQSRGVIRCRDLADMSEVEIRDELKDQGVVGVSRVTLKKEGKVIPTNTLFLMFSSPELPKEITVGHLKVKTALLVPNPMRCFNCNKFDHTSHRCKVAAKCSECGKDKHEGRCKGPKLCQVTQAVL